MTATATLTRTHTRHQASQSVGAHPGIPPAVAQMAAAVGLRHATPVTPEQLTTGMDVATVSQDADGLAVHTLRVAHLTDTAVVPTTGDPVPRHADGAHWFALPTRH